MNNMSAWAIKAPIPSIVVFILLTFAGIVGFKKLGIKKGSKVALAGAPAGFEKQLEPLPEDAKVSRGAVASPDLLLLFVRTQAELKRRFPAAAKRVAGGGRIWICWPKQESGQAKDLNGHQVRAFGLAQRWVDFKICAVDATWSGLKLVIRRKLR